MGQWTKARIQLCGHFVADIDGSRIEDTLPGRIGRVMFAYLVLNRGRPVPRDMLLMAGWGEDAPAETRNALNVLLSKLRHGLGATRPPRGGGVAAGDPHGVARRRATPRGRGGAGRGRRPAPRPSGGRVG